MSFPSSKSWRSAFGMQGADVPDRLAGHTFGVEIDGEIFVRSVSGIDLEKGAVSFFCDINPGDELLLLKAKDFAGQTSSDYQAFLRGKPEPLGLILNDCILRRLNNGAGARRIDDLWSAPAAGLSTFGELFGINVNETLSAIVFFEDRAGYRDEFLDAFPIHYARFVNYFTKCALKQAHMLNSLPLGHHHAHGRTARFRRSRSKPHWKRPAEMREAMERVRAAICTSAKAEVRRQDDIRGAIVARSSRIWPIRCRACATCCGSSTISPDKPIFWRSTPPSRRRAPATRGAVFPWWRRR